MRLGNFELFKKDTIKIAINYAYALRVFHYPFLYLCKEMLRVRWDRVGQRNLPRWLWFSYVCN